MNEIKIIFFYNSIKMNFYMTGGLINEFIFTVIIGKDFFKVTQYR